MRLKSNLAQLCLLATQQKWGRFDLGPIWLGPIWLGADLTCFQVHGLLHLGISFVQGLMDYFEDTYIGRPGRRQRWDPRFSHDMWNVNQRTLQELPRTDNIEGWHRGFQSLIGSRHPNIWTFLGKLKRQQSAEVCLVPLLESCFLNLSVHTLGQVEKATLYLYLRAYSQ
jgi:hypothetical protein